jgi:hypothetical protein
VRKLAGDRVGAGAGTTQSRLSGEGQRREVRSAPALPRSPRAGAGYVDWGWESIKHPVGFVEALSVQHEDHITTI